MRFFKAFNSLFQEPYPEKLAKTSQDKIRRTSRGCLVKIPVNILKGIAEKTNPLDFRDESLEEFPDDLLQEFPEEFLFLM